MIIFLEYDHLTLQQVLSQSHFIWRDNQPALSLKKLMQIPQVEIKQVKKVNDEIKIDNRIISWK